MRLFLLFILLAHLFLLSSCKKYQPATPTFFLKSNNVVVSPKGANNTTTNQKITDLWFYVDGQFEGIYPVGNLMPVPCNNQNVTINVFAGIKNNGISDTRIFYPFFDFIRFDTLVKGGATIERNFTFSYKAATVFTWTENFDVINGRSVHQVGAGVMDNAPKEDSFENQSLRVTLPSGGVNTRIISSSDGFVLPPSTGNVFLELNYKCNAPFTVGLMGDDGSPSPAIVVNAQTNWNKIYVQLSTPVNTLITSKYKVYFEMLGDGTPGDKQMFLDNIKLLFLPPS